MQPGTHRFRVDVTLPGASDREFGFQPRGGSGGGKTSEGWVATHGRRPSVSGQGKWEQAFRGSREKTLRFPLQYDCQLV
jgi:hypothetical protein